MVTRIIALAALLISVSKTFAAEEPFKFNSETCTVGSTNDIDFEGEFVSKIKTEIFMSEGSLKLPRIRLSFLAHEPEHVAVHWEEIATEKSGKLWFRPEIVDRLRLEENKAFAMKRVNPGQAGAAAIFETDVLDFDRSQDLVALFLSQRTMIIDAGPEGVNWKGTQHLSGTDGAFRLLAAKCHPELSKAYVKSSGRPISQAEIKGLSPIALLYSEGYGLTEFSWIRDLLPSDLRVAELLPPGLKERELQSRMELLWAELTKKRAALAAADAASKNKSYVQLDSLLKESFSQLAQSYDRFIALTGDSEAQRGLISSKMDEQTELNSKILDLTARIAAAVSDRANTGKALSETEATIAPHNAQMKSLGDGIAALEQQSAAILALQARLQRYLSDEERVLALASAEPIPTAPWSVEEIEARRKENQERQTRLAMLANLKARVESISAELQPVLDKAAVQQSAFDAHSAIGPEIQNYRDELAKEERWLQKRGDIPNFQAADEVFGALTASIEARITEKQYERKYEPEFDFVEQAFKTSVSEFNSIQTRAEAGSLPVLTGILCPPGAITDPSLKKRSCLNFDEAMDARIAETFVNELSPSDLDRLVGHVQKPWNESESKVDLIWSRLRQEIDQPSAELTEMLAKWTEIRFLVWRWSTMQKKADAFAPCAEPKPVELFSGELYSQAYYDRVFQCQREETASHQANRERLIAALADAKGRQEQAYLSFDQADADFDQVSRDFVSRSISGLDSFSQALDMSPVISLCVIPLKDAENCGTAVRNSVVLADQTLTQETNIYLDLAKTLILNINGRIAVLAADNQAVVDQTIVQRQVLSDYMVQNGVDQMIAARDTLVKKLADLEAQLQTLSTAKSKQLADLASSDQMEFRLREEAGILVQSIQSAKTDIQARMPELNAFCAPILENLGVARQADGVLRDLIAPGTQARTEELYSSCEMPDLAAFTTTRPILMTTP